MRRLTIPYFFHAPRSAPPPARKRRYERVLTLGALIAMAAGLWLSRPVRWLPGGRGDERTRSCLSNLNRIALACAQYAADYDGKFPRGVDPVDRAHPESWRPEGAAYEEAVRQMPLLPEVLHPYTRDPEAWHCPADMGWDVSRLQTALGWSLSNVHPSSYERFGTSYYYLTIHGLAGWTGADLSAPYSDVLMFDGDYWHQADEVASLNVLFSDGHAQNVTPQRFNALVKAN